MTQAKYIRLFVMMLDNKNGIYYSLSKRIFKI